VGVAKRARERSPPPPQNPESTKHNIFNGACFWCGGCRRVTRLTTLTLTRRYLPPRVAAWRYQRGSRSLLHNLQAPSGEAAVAAVGGASGVGGAGELAG
jgi:hypothetical protein